MTRTYAIAAHLASTLNAHPAAYDAYFQYMGSADRGERLGALVAMFDGGLTVTEISELTNQTVDHVAAFIAASLSIR